MGEKLSISNPPTLFAVPQRGLMVAKNTNVISVELPLTHQGGLILKLGTTLRHIIVSAPHPGADTGFCEGGGQVLYRGA